MPIENVILNNVTAILTAAGKGSRFRKLSGSTSNTPKQFIRIFNKPVILYSLLTLQKCPLINRIIITSAKENFEYLHGVAAKNKITKLDKLVEGGNTRAESVRNAFLQIENPKNILVLIHDAARPNITVSLVEKIISEAKKSGSVITGSRLTETIKRSENGRVIETLDRKNLWSVQTPQVFPYTILKKSYSKIKNLTKLSLFTDESSLIENAGFKVKIMEGSKDNIKITTPEDLDLVKKMMIKR